MTEPPLASLMNKYDQSGHLRIFISDYLNIRDLPLQDKPITPENLDLIMPKIIKSLDTKLERRMNPSLN